MLDDGAGVDDGVGIYPREGVHDRQGPDEDAVAEGRRRRYVSARRNHGRRRTGVGVSQPSEHAFAQRDVAEAYEEPRPGGGWRRQAPQVGEFQPCDRGGVGPVVENAGDGEAEEAERLGDDEGVTSASYEHNAVLWALRHADTFGDALVRAEGNPAEGRQSFLYVGGDARKNEQMDPVRIGIVKFLNTVPLADGLDKVHGLALVPAAPSGLGAMLERGEIDLGLVSVIDAARSSVPLSMLSCGMIGSDGPTLTVRLFSAVPASSIRTLHADPDSHTSVALARIVLRRLVNVRAKVESFDPSAGEWPESLVLIGDKVVTASPPAVQYPHQLDLGEEWKKLTGLPFVYALWMCRSADLDDAERRQRIGVGAALLDRQLRHNLTRLNRIIEDRAPQFGWPRDLARRYIGELLRYRVGEAEKSAVARFFEECVAADLIAPDRAITHWVE